MRSMCCASISVSCACISCRSSAAPRTQSIDSTLRFDAARIVAFGAFDSFIDTSPETPRFRVCAIDIAAARPLFWAGTFCAQPGAQVRYIAVRRGCAHRLDSCCDVATSCAA
ncbi:exported hypothetical protein [Paraburkholderia tropica]|nr:exported hypothetical protein [Paraburkholderia tropica]